MSTWRCFLAIIFALVWYFSEFGQICTQAFFCGLCFLNFPFKKQDSETSTQTDETIESKKGHNVGAIDEIDATDATRTGQIPSQTMQYPNVHRSLFHVFKCAYAQLVQPWYTVPELGDSQPLYRVLHKEYSVVVERIICKAKNFDLSSTSVGCIRILTQHLHNAKQTDGSPAFGSRSEEMAVLRTLSEALVRNLFPECLWQAKLYQCVLTEIVATKALDVLVTYLCNPDNLNQMVVFQLDRVTPKGSFGDLVNSDRDVTSSLGGSEEAEELTDEAEDARSEDIKGKKKVGRIREKFFKFVDKVKPKKTKRKKHKEQELLQRRAFLPSRRSAVIENDGASSREGSIGSCLWSDYDSETDVFPRTVEEEMEFKLSYEMWRVGKWAVRVTNVQIENEELCFTVHLEESDNPENLHWDVKKTQSDILNFHSLLQDTSTLPSISAIVENTKKELGDAYAEEVKSAFEHFLQELVSDKQLGHTQSVFQFLGPFAGLLSDEEHEGSVWSLLNRLASFLTPSLDEDESHNSREDKLDEAGASTHHGGPRAQPACIYSNEEPKGGVIEGPKASNVQFCARHEETDPFKRREQDIQDNGQISDDPDVVSDGLESLAETLDTFVNRSKLVLPTGHSSEISNSVISLTESLQSESSDCFRSAQSGGKTNKKEKLTQKKSNGLQKLKVKEKKDEVTNQPQTQKKEPQTNWEQVEATKAILDLLKEVTGKPFLINFFDAILKPFQSLVKKKINNFLKSMHPTEDQIASSIDKFLEGIWPDGNVPYQPPCDSEEKQETKEKALQLIISKYSNSLIPKKIMEAVFKIFQDTEENKKLVYRLLLCVLMEFLPREPAFSSIAYLFAKDCVL